MHLPTVVPTTPAKRVPLLSLSLGLLIANSLLAQVVAPTPNPSPSTAPKTPTTTEVKTGADAAADTVVLSPFEVNAAGDNGYAVSSTLAGNRLNTNLRDIGSAISVINEQFLRDIGAYNNETLLQYTTNTEIGSVYGNFSGAGGVQGTQLEETGRFVAPNMNTRVRGLASADNTIDFFLTDIPWDGYAVDRVDQQRGPNAILFGLGQPGGIINANTKQAGFRNRGSVEVRYSSFNSLRTSIDYNQVLIPKQLAVRIDALRNDEKFQQDPAFQRDQRVFGTLRYEPGFLNRSDFAKTTLRINGEKGHVRSNRPRSVPPGDGISPFFYTGTAQGFTTTGAPFTYNNINGKGFDARGLQDRQMTGQPDRGEFQPDYPLNGNGATTANPYYQPWLGGQFAAGYFGNPMAIFEGAGGTARLANWEPNVGLITAGGSLPARGGLNAAGAIVGGIDGVPFSRMSSLTIYRDWARKTNQPGAKFGLTRNLILTDPSIFNFYDNLIDGPNKSEWQNFERFNVNLSQTFFRGNVGLEAVIDRQYYDNGQLVFMTDKGQVLYIDPIRVMADGTTNPNFGRPFISDGTGSNRHTFIDRASERFTGFVKHDFSKSERKNIVTRILGRHVLTGFYNEDERKSDTRGFLRYGTDLAYKDFAFGPNSNQNIDSGNRTIYPVVYLGQSLSGKSSASGANISRPTGTAVASSGNIRIFDSTWTATGVNPGDVWVNPDYPVGHVRRTSTQSENPANYRGWTSRALTVIDSEQGNRDALTTNANLTKSTVESQAYVWNGHFWDGAIVGMFGWRRDISKAWSYAGERFPAGPASNANINLDPSVYRLPARYRDYIDEESHSWSIVAHLSQIFPRERMPVDVSLFYNQSENFAASAGRVGPLNEPLGPPRGKTKDMGFMLATKDGKYSLRFNRYESEATNASSSGFNSFYLPGLFTGYHNQFNVYKYKIDGNLFNLSGTQGTDPNRWTWAPRVGQTQDQANAEQTASLAAWEKMIAAIPAEFFTAYRMNIGAVELLTSTTPAGLTVTEDNSSKGVEVDLTASPMRNLRLTFNVGKQEAFRRNIGPTSMTDLIATIHTALATTPAGLMRNSSSSSAETALTGWNNNFYAQYAPLKFTESTAVPELRKWRANFVANYDFRDGFLKNVNVGAAYRWQDKIVIGYPPEYLDAAGGPAVNPQVALVWRPQLDKPFYGPAEHNVDLWIGYKRQLTKRLAWRAQLNVRNVGKDNYLIPINVQPDGTAVGYRIAPVQTWSLSNTLEF
ncbi:MAG TPA: TonB-dependent receptor [Opitutaceae bacterium]|nr:TonB-dependent receptor [Opitutaceae bacterium]